MMMNIWFEYVWYILEQNWLSTAVSLLRIRLSRSLWSSTRWDFTVPICALWVAVSHCRQVLMAGISTWSHTNLFCLGRLFGWIAEWSRYWSVSNAVTSGFDDLIMLWIEVRQHLAHHPMESEDLGYFLWCYNTWIYNDYAMILKDGSNDSGAVPFSENNVMIFFKSPEVATWHHVTHVEVPGLQVNTATATAAPNWVLLAELQLPVRKDTFQIGSNMSLG